MSIETAKFTVSDVTVAVNQNIDIYDEFGRIVARVENDTYVDGLPYAHLLAAAPDLYRALEALVNAKTSDFEEIDRIYKEAKAALAKARGEG